jgi:hypothetical protein
VKAESDIFALWAAEELVAAGRASCPNQRQAHRRQGEFLADVCQGLRKELAPRRHQKSDLDSEIGTVLARAFDTTGAKRQAGPNPRPGKR